jgi:hypothetical protein
MDSDGNLDNRLAWHWTRYDGRTVIRAEETPNLASAAAEVARQAGIPRS